jgi:HD superfamily phosphodiesterase
MFINKLFAYVTFICKKYEIDESHGLTHSMNVLNHAQNIYNSEVGKNPFLEAQQKIIYTAAILHDMCDKKYIDETEGVQMIVDYIKDDVTLNELDVIKTIIKTMSYSKVTLFGYPMLGEYMLAYHIVREADLLSAYDFNRCMIYGINKKENCKTIMDSFIESRKLFNHRVLKYIDDALFITEYSKTISKALHEESIKSINLWEKLYSYKIDVEII